MTLEITLQLKNASYTYEDLKKTAGDIWKNDIKGGDIEKMSLYIKPEDKRCYTVINGEPFSFGI